MQTEQNKYDLSRKSTQSRTVLLMMLILWCQLPLVLMFKYDFKPTVQAVVS
jgi:hypothetical protein